MIDASVSKLKLC